MKHADTASTRPLRNLAFGKATATMVMNIRPIAVRADCGKTGKLMNATSLQTIDSIAILTLDQPESRVNVLSRSMWSELESICQGLAKRPDLRGLIIDSNKPGIFIAGADLKELSGVPSPDDPATRDFIEQGLRVLESLETLPFPTAACIDGAALGGGLEVTLACDFRLAGTNPKIKLGLPEVTLGLIPGWGGTQRLPRIIGVTSALEQILTNLQFDADTARYRGLVAKVVPSENLRAEASQLLQESHANGDWQPLREKKQKPLDIDRTGMTMEEMNHGRFSEAKSNAMSLSPEALNAFRQNVEEQMAASLSRRAALAVLEVVANGCLLPLKEAIGLETAAFLQLAAGEEARQLIASFFASRRK
jgi:enoyl-CoA hydratase/carnithine racemase